jgi:riboflavin kinase/FMN adenylyltransferase
VLLPFTQDLANLSPQAFVEEILVQRLQAQQISVGQDFCFGRQRSGTAVDLQRIAAQYGIPVQVASLHTCQGERISSSAIRHALEAGNLKRANQLLGRPYTLLGHVIQGQQLGRTIGFPTANLQLPPEKFLPCQGVYSVWVHFLSSDFELTPQPPQPGVMNIGNRPTVNGSALSVEVHLLDWNGNLYGEHLMICLEGFLRPEQKFSSLDELKAQIQADCEVARSRLSVSQISIN